MDAANEQYRYEIDVWLRTLDYLQQESTSLKNRMARVVKRNSRSDMLEKADHFRKDLLNKDELIALLRREIQTLQSSEGADRTAIQEILRHDMQKVEKEFYNLKIEANVYIQNVLIDKGF